MSNINGCNEIIEDNRNGIIIQIKNENALFDAMKKMANEASLMSEMKINCRPMIVSKYDQKLVWEAILAEYRTFDNK